MREKNIAADLWHEETARRRSQRQASFMLSIAVLGLFVLMYGALWG